ncbi:MAG: hypothetical protein JW810_04210 [Sedimentisphaerales bacterium]|nr:hypothetical protein [Sedimentisphaerales bacterium]
MRIAWALTIVAVTAVISAGCEKHRWYSRAGYVTQENPPPGGFCHDPTWLIFFKTTYFYPVRDWFDLEWQQARLRGQGVPAKNLTADGRVPDSSFFVIRPIRDVPPTVLARGPNQGPDPAGPWKIIKRKKRGVSRGFIGSDGQGRTYLVKLDNRAYPQLASGAEVIAAKIYWALGYNVPPTYVVTISGTGDSRFDGRRALASRLVAGKVMGNFKFNWVRDRREFRALRLAAAWLNDTDRADQNLLAALDEGRYLFYLVDFNGSLGSYRHGIAKEPWIGCRYAWDVERQLTGLLRLVTLGLIQEAGCRHSEILASPTLGYLPGGFDPARWRPETPNPAFDRMTRRDAAWMADRIAAFSAEQIETIVAEARLDDPADARRLVEVLRGRQRAIVQRYGQTADTAGTAVTAGTADATYP